MKVKYITPFVSEAFFETVKRGMKDAAEMFNVETEFIGTEDADSEKLVDMIQKAVKEGCQGLAVSMVDPSEMEPAIREAKKANVPTVAFNIGAQKDSEVLCNVVQDFVNAGRLVGKRAAFSIKNNSSVLLTLHDDVEVLRQREKGIKEGLEGKNLTYYTIVSGNDPEIAARAIRDELKRHRDITAILGTGQNDTEGAGIVARETGIYTAGFDLSEKILELIQQRYVDFTIDQQPYVQGFYPLMQLYQNVKYGLVPCDIDTGNGLIGKENVDEVISIYKQGYR